MEVPFKNMQVIALSDSLAPWHSFWIRFGQYVDSLDIHVVITENRHMLTNLRRGDVLFIYRYKAEWECLAEDILAIRKQGVVVFADLDDYLWNAVGWSKERLKGVTRLIRACSFLTCSTRALQEQLAIMFKKDIFLVPNTAPRQFRGQIQSYERNDDSEKVRIGWTGAPWIRPNDLEEIRGLAQWVVSHCDVMSFVHIGDGYGKASFAEVLGIDEQYVEVFPLDGHSNYLTNFNFDIGLAPLANTGFNQFKSAVKVIEYSSFSIPWIASKHLVYEEHCSSWGLEGRLCSCSDDWIRHVSALLVKKTRIREGIVAKELCERFSSHRSGIDAWKAILLKVSPGYVADE